MFKYQHVYDEQAFRDIISLKEKELTVQLNKLKLDINADLIFIAVRQGDVATTLISLDSTGEINNLTYELNGSPCEQILDKNSCCFPADVCKLFPNDKALQDMGIEGYIGSPIKNEDDENIGILVALYKLPHKNLKNNINLFELFATYLSTYVQKCHLDNRTSSHLSLLNQVEAISNTGSWEYHVNTAQVFWSDEIFNIYGLSVNDVSMVDKALSFYTDHDRPIVTHLFETAISKGTPYEGEYEIIDSHGAKKWVKTNGIPEFDDKGNVIRIYGAFEDITTEKELFLLNKERADQIENILNHINDAVITINSKGIILHTNNVALRVFGYLDGELEGINISNLIPEPYSSMHHKYMEQYQETGEPQILGVGRQLPAKRKNGDIFQMELVVTKSENHGETQYIGVVRDITERLKAQDTIYNLAFTDNVTLLRNSQWFEKECKELMQRAEVNEGCIHVLLLDIDKMGLLNLQVGFDKGDKVLQKIAVNLQNVIGLNYKIYKYNADSFVILSTISYNKSHLYKFRPTLIEKVLLDEDNFIVDLDKQKLMLTASLGSAIFDPSKQSFESMINILEHALRKAKAEAPFGLHHVGEEGISEYYRYLTIQKLLKTVVDSKELSLVMQPQYNNKGGLNSFEALIRWQSSELGSVSPAEFIPIAEETDAIISIGDWVLLKACNAIKELVDKGLDMSISVNISTKQIIASDFVNKLIVLVKKLDVPPKMLMLEITETALVADIAIVKNTMNVLSDYGFRFSVDDFGTGYSSLSYLKELSISELKIDKYFVDDITVDDIDKPYAIVDAIIDMAKALGVKSVAEGVEELAQYNYLKRKGCDIYQGYLFSKPIIMDTWREMIANESCNVVT